MKKLLFYIFFFGFSFLVFSQPGKDNKGILNKIETHINSGEYDVASKLLANFSESEIKNLDKFSQAHYYFLHAKIKNNSKDYKKAEEDLKYLLKNYKHVLEKDKKLISKTYLELATSSNGNYNQKYEIYYTKKALEVLETNPNLFTPQEIIISYNGLYYYQNNYDDAKGVYQTYLKFQNYFRKIPKESESYPFARRVFRKMEVTITLQNNQPEKAKQILEDFKKECYPNPTDNDIAYINACYSEIADYYYYYKEAYEEAIAFSRSYIQYAKATKSLSNQMLAYSKTGSSYLKLNDYEKALQELDLSIGSVNWSGFSSSFSSLQTLRAICFSGLKKYDKATEIAEKTLKDIVQYKTGKSTEILAMNYNEFRELNSHYIINIFASCGHIFLEKYQAHHQKKDLEKAEKLFQISSKMFNEFYLKGEFSPLLHNLHTKIAEGMLNVALEKYEGNLSKISEIINIIENNSSKHLYKEFLRKRDFTDSIQANNFSLEYGNLISKVQENLSKDEQIVKFYVGNKDVFQLIINKDKIKLRKLGAEKNIKNIVQNYITKIKNPRSDFSRNTQLSNILLPELSAKKIIIISDGFLNYLPFESLGDENGFFINNFNFSYNYSLAMWFANRNRKTVNPINISVFAPEYRVNSQFQNIPISPLVYAKKEAKNILSRFSGKSFLDENATKQQFIKESPTSKILHLSMHSILDEDNFRKSCLLFQNNVPLYFEELYQLNIPAEMVVLGACDTGNGSLKNGEGIMSISHAFTFAGSKSNVLSLWKVPDKETAEIIDGFYKFLKKGQKKDDALANAKREFVKNNPLKNHPYFWAGFIVNGNTNPITESNKLWIFLAVLGIIVIGSFWFVKKKSR